jgi:hypothetical protein
MTKIYRKDLLAKVDLIKQAIVSGKVKEEEIELWLLPTEWLKVLESKVNELPANVLELDKIKEIKEVIERLKTSLKNLENIVFPS